MAKRMVLFLRSRRSSIQVTRAGCLPLPVSLVPRMLRHQLESERDRGGQAAEELSVVSVDEPGLVLDLDRIVTLSANEFE